MTNRYIFLLAYCLRRTIEYKSRSLSITKFEKKIELGRLMRRTFYFREEKLKCSIN